MENHGVGDAGISFWRRKFHQIILVALAVDVTIVFVVVIGSFIPLIPKETSTTCSTQTCIEEEGRISHRVSPQVNPCEDLHGFVCGKFQKNHDSTTVLKEEARKQMIELYIEPSKLGEHQLVTTIKKLFRACLTEATTQISTSNIEEIKNALKMAGGWPVLEGPKWDERKFSWLQATYKFRELGYRYNVFVDLFITRDPRNISNHILGVSLPELEVVRKEFMTKIAILFGANETNAAKEVDEMCNYMLQLFSEIRNSSTHHTNMIFSPLSACQQKQGTTINWLEVISKIIGPAARISHKDWVLFTNPETITMWFNLLSKIPKRIQANYMMWRAIEEVVSDIKLDEQREQYLYFAEYSTEGCLEKLQNRFRTFPNPIDVMYIRKYLPANKLKMVEDLVNNVKVTFLELLRKADWLDIKDKMSIINTMRDITNRVIIGAPKIYFQDTILDEMAVDLGKLDNPSYLKVLLLVNKNYQSLFYKQIYSSVDEKKFLFWNMLRATEQSLHYYTDNAIALPATMLQGAFFNENRPNYLNYGALGSFIAAEYAYQLANVILAEEATTWSNKTQNGFLNIRRCFLQQVMDNLKINGVMTQWDYEMLCQSLSTHISYTAYQTWEKSNGVEPRLANSTYSNYQLFWISAGSFYCQYLYTLPTIFNVHKLYSFYVSGIGLNNDNFAKDFRCPLESKMNPLEKCYVF